MVSVSVACFSMDSCITSVKVGLRDIEYKKEYKGDELELQYAVEEHLYPPAISLQVVQSEVSSHLRLHKRILLRVHGAKEGAMNFPIDFLEEKEGLSCIVYVHLLAHIHITYHTHSNYVNIVSRIIE